MSKRVFTAKTPAKINIGLHVLHKRRDRYHDIESIFYPVKLYDKIKVEIIKLKSSRHIVSVHTSPKGLVDDKQNICLKAVKSFLRKFEIADGYRINISIKKNIPVGAGLGGGSSNAASVLKILFGYYKNFYKSINKESLLILAAELGSDVPFFINPVTSYVYSRGEKLKPLRKFRLSYDILIVYPAFKISTGWAYEKLNVHGNKRPIFDRIKSFYNVPPDLFYNDFENVVFKRYPGIEEIKETMYILGSEFASLSGSGSSVYGFFKRINTEPALQYFTNMGYQVFRIKS